MLSEEDCAAAAIATTRSLLMSVASKQPTSTRPMTRRCGFPECIKTAKPGGFCISHGGGKKCCVEGCNTSVVSRGRCVAHGGGKRCQHQGCTKSAQTGGFCWIHGGGKKCGYDGCTKRAQSGGACIAHGGGKRCRIDGCNKVVQYEGLCVGHGGYRKCLSMNCMKKALSSGYCALHGGNTRCRTSSCKRKAVHSDLCANHQHPESPGHDHDASGLLESPHQERNPTLAPAFDVLKSSWPSPLPHKQLRAASMNSSRDVSIKPTFFGDTTVEKPIAPGVGHRLAAFKPLPTLNELHINSVWRRSLPQAIPSLRAEYVYPPREEIRAAVGTTKFFLPSLDALTRPCALHQCSRLAKVDGRCLQHAMLQG